MQSVSGTELIVLLAWSLICAAFGYFLSEWTRKSTGRTPWGLPSLLWGFFWFLSLAIGAILYLIARITDGRRAQRTGGPFVPAASPAAPPARAWDAGSQFPAYPRPANSPGSPEPPGPVGSAEPPGPPEPPASVVPPAPVVPPASVVPPAPEPAAPVPAVPVPPAPVPPAPPPAVPASPPAWHPDPSGRFHYRWWDGARWTNQVSTNGHHLIDTDPSQRLGP